MFKLNGEFTGLDNFFYTDEPNHVLSHESIKKRLGEMQGIYRTWEYGLFKFPLDEEERNEVQNRCHDSIELMREAANDYMLAFFNGTIILSSMAVERVLQGLLILQGNQWRDLEENCLTPAIEYEIKKPKPLGEIGLKTELYGHRNGRLVQYAIKGGSWKYLEIPSLSESLNKVSRKLAPIDLLQDEAEKNLKPSECIFVKRRNTMAHSAMENLRIYSQSWQLNLKGKVDLDTFINNKADAFDQYKKASFFIMGVFEVLKKRYETW